MPAASLYLCVCVCVSLYLYLSVRLLFEGSHMHERAI